MRHKSVLVHPPATTKVVEGLAASSLGYGPAWLFNSYSVWYWWGYAEFDMATNLFSYHYGYEDYP